MFKWQPATTSREAGWHTVPRVPMFHSPVVINRVLVGFVAIAVAVVVAAASAAAAAAAAVAIVTVVVHP